MRRNNYGEWWQCPRCGWWVCFLAYHLKHCIAEARRLKAEIDKE